METEQQPKPPKSNRPLKISEKDLEKTLEELVKKIGVKVDKIKSKKPPVPQLPFNLNWQLLKPWLYAAVLLLMILGWIVAGFFQVLPGEQALSLRFGAYHLNYAEGVHWAPRFIDKVYVFNAAHLYKLNEQQEAFSQDGKLVVLNIEVDYKISDGQAFFFNHVDSLATLRAATLSAIYQLSAQHDFTKLTAPSSLSLASLTQDLTTYLKSMVDKYQLGVSIDAVDIKGITLPDAVLTYAIQLDKVKRKAEQDFKQVLQYQQNLIAVTEAAKDKLLQEAQTFGEIKVLQAEADLAHYQALLPFYKKAPEIMRERLYLETLDAILSANSTILLDMKQNGSVVSLGLDKLIDNLEQQLLSRKQAAAAPEESLVKTMPKVNEQLPTKASLLEENRPTRSGSKVRPSY